MAENCYSIIYLEMDILAIINRHDIINSTVRIYLSESYQTFLSPRTISSLRQEREHAIISNIYPLYMRDMSYLKIHGNRTSPRHFIEMNTSRKKYALAIYFDILCRSN